jgi:TonB-linked SusC/RagA family outer membrane protein
MLLATVHLFAQQTVNVAGIVMDEKGEELPGVTVAVKGNNTLGTATDIDGRFRISIPANSTLVFSCLGYQTKEITYGTSNRISEKIGLSENVNELNEVVVTAMGSQRKVSVVGAITTVNPGELQVPATSVSNMLLGRVPGIIGVTRSGEPGNNFSEFWIRGISTFGASQSALILIDGVEGNLNDLDPEDIESFSILKDASATAVYGVRGANGVVIVTTKRGKAGKISINFKANASYSYSPRMPEYADAYNYALLANEAREVRGYDPIYNDIELDIFRHNLDPDLYPNVSWRDVILKDYTVNPSYHLNISGGGTNARYYMSIGYQQNEALFKQDNTVANKNTNVNYNKYNFRSNIDVNLTKTTEISLNLETVFASQNAPGDGLNNDALWSAQANLPPPMVPVRYSNGQLPTYGSNVDEMSPYIRLNYLGSIATERYSTKTNVSLNQDLSMITEGLSVSGLFSLVTNGRHAISMSKRPDLYYADPKDGRNLDGTLRTVRKLEKQDLTTAQNSYSNREYYFETNAKYNRSFSDDHRVTGLVHYYMQEKKNSEWGNSQLSAYPRRYMALSSRLTYSFKDTYMVEGNVGYTGSENFNKGRRFGLFPSIALGWAPSQYEFVEENLPFISYLKFRGSYGEVGNDRLKDGDTDIRFPYLTIVGGDTSGPWGGTAIGETTTGATNMEWETTHKYNLGIDLKLFKGQIDFTVDFFRNKTSGIFQKRANIPDEVGMTSVLPYSNIGSMTSWGTDGTLAFHRDLGKDMNLTLRGNLTLARSLVDYWEQTYNYPYQSYSGVPYGIHRGLIALGLFSDEDEIRSSPVQTYMSNVMPGDIKYRDVNGDGKIDDDDIVPLSYSNIPNIQYGFAVEYRWTNFTASIFFEGVNEVEYFLGGTGYYPFAWETRGNLLSIAANPANRWIPADYAAAHGIEPSLAENPNARFPRLYYGNNANNNRSSSFWLADGSYLRLKNIQLAYRIPGALMKKIGLESATVSAIGDNLKVWDKVKLWDPGQASSNGGVYPLQRIYTLQLHVTF